MPHFCQAIAADPDRAVSEVLDLQECCRMAIREDPDVQYLVAQGNIAWLQADEAKLDLYVPQVGLETSYGPKLDFFGRPITSERIYSSTVTVEKPIYKGGENITAYRLGKTKQENAQYGYVYRINEIIGDVTKKYFILLHSRQIHERYQALYDFTLQSIELLERQFQMGSATRLEYLEAKTFLNQNTVKLAGARSEANLAMAALNEAIGLDPKAYVEIEPVDPPAAPEGQIKEWIDLSMENRADLLRQQTQVEFERLRVDLVKSKTLPTVSVFGSYSWQGDDVIGQEKDWRFGLKLNYSFGDHSISSGATQYRLYENEFNFQPEDTDFDMEYAKLSLFDGSSKKIDLENARADFQLSQDRLKKLQRSIKKEVIEAEQKFRVAETVLKSSLAEVRNGKEKLQLIGEKKRFNQASTVDVLDMRRELAETEVKYLKGRNEFVTAVIDLYNAIGKRWKREDLPF